MGNQVRQTISAVRSSTPLQITKDLNELKDFDDDHLESPHEINNRKMKKELEL